MAARRARAHRHIFPRNPCALGRDLGRGRAGQATHGSIAVADHADTEQGTCGRIAPKRSSTTFQTRVSSERSLVTT